jgi:hypothetical protein
MENNEDLFNCTGETSFDVLSLKILTAKLQVMMPVFFVTNLIARDENSKDKTSFQTKIAFY